MLARKNSDIQVINIHMTPLGSFGGWTNQQYLPEKLKSTVFYKPVLAGKEKKLAAIYKKLKEFQKKK